jgi:2-polyprenyl-3-methyl-5-hydroxy-6-metoxy-1,4-benzoquinol methylase
MTDTREFAKFDVVVAIEIIEHIKNAKAFIEILVKKFDKRNKNDPTVYFFSTPNRNNKIIDKTHPRNNFHVREWTSGEFHKLLLQYFNKVELMNSRGEPIPLDEYETTVHTPILAKCEGAK